MLLAALPALIGCQTRVVQQGEPVLSPAALAAIAPGYGASATSPSREALARAVDALFTRAESGDTQAMIVRQGGTVVAERYADGITPATRLPGDDIAATVTTLMIGLMVGDGLLALDQPVLIAAWQRQGDPRAQITLRQLLTGEDGLGGTTDDDLAMLDGPGRDAMATAAEQRAQHSPPGEVWHDTPARAVILADIAAATLAPHADAATRQRALAQFLASRLLVPLGAQSLSPGWDRAGTMVAGSQIDGTVADFARIGTLIAAHGKVGDKPLLAPAWIALMTRPGRIEPQYGAGLWLNRAGRSIPSRLFEGVGAHDACAAIGRGGAVLLVVPSRQLVIVRLGRSSPTQWPALRGALSDLIALWHPTSAAHPAARERH